MTSDEERRLLELVKAARQLRALVLKGTNPGSARYQAKVTTVLYALRAVEEEQKCAVRRALRGDCGHHHVPYRATAR